MLGGTADLPAPVHKYASSREQPPPPTHTAAQPPHFEAHAPQWDSKWEPPAKYGLVEQFVYRSAFPTPGSFEFLKLLGLRTVINLSQVPFCHPRTLAGDADRRTVRLACRSCR